MGLKESVVFSTTQAAGERENCNRALWKSSQSLRSEVKVGFGVV